VPKFDLAKTEALSRLFVVPRAQRDDAWRAAFYDAVVDASLATTAEQTLQGPDGFPYFALKLPTAGQPFTPFCVSQILEHCTDRGYGVVVEPQAQGAQWVFTYGDLFSLRAYGSFEGDPADREGARAAEDEPHGVTTEAIPRETPVMVGAPSEAMLPKWARSVLAGFVTRNTPVKEPRVLVMVDASRPPGRHLVFNVHPEEAPKPETFRAILRAFGWFMPPGRSVVGLSRESELTREFVPLVDPVQ
jgi:hypothetical protein